MITVVVPVYNGEKTIRETIISITEQTFKDIEILIINDSSQDATLEVVKQIKDERIKVFSYPNKGSAASRNRGLANALVRLSLSLTYSGIRQLKSHRLVISTRLHGHILCLLLGIPNIFLSNSYYKNQSFYEAWNHDVPFSKFVQDVSEVPEPIENLSKFMF